MDETSPINGPETLEGTFYFDPKDPIYQDHFPGNPVVPGSLIVDAFLQTGIEQGWIEEGVRIETFRFSRFVSPGTTHFQMEFLEGGKILNCKLHARGCLLVTGRLRP